MPIKWRLAQSLITLREQVNERWPARDKASDGARGDTAHSQRKSDHNPNSAGVVTAIDIDRELGGQPDGSNAGDTVAVLVAKLQASKDARIKYLIWNAQMIRSYTAKDGTPPWTWTPYDGPNAHKHHLHISVSSDPKLYDDTRAWNLNTLAAISMPDSAVTTPPDMDKGVLSPDLTDSRVDQSKLLPPILKRGSKGAGVRAVQNKLIELGYDLKADGIFLQKTYDAVIAFQRAKKLYVDGRVGPEVRAALHL